MEVKWIVFLTFAGLAVSFCAGNRCNTDVVFACYNNLVHHEGLGFPLYGEDELALDETCNSINESFACLDDYLRACNEKEDCDDKCKEMIKDIGMFILNTGLRTLQNELCDPLSALRLTYLENYVCLEDNAIHYAKCQNDSQLSQEYLSTITDHAEALYARCCFFSWYEGCFTNVTRESCNENTTLYVSMSLHYLMGHIVDLLCKNSDVTCSEPPMPPGGNPVLTNNDEDNCLDKDCSMSSTGHPHDQMGDDNCTDCLSSSSLLVYSVSHLFVSLSCIVLYKYLIAIK